MNINPNQIISDTGAGPMPRKRSKYRNKRVMYKGIWFDSVAEKRRYMELEIALAAKDIKDLECQPKFLLQDKFEDRNGNKHRAIHYIADFKYFDRSTGEMVVEDVKGKETKDFKIKMKLFLKKYPQYVFRLVK